MDQNSLVAQISNMKAASAAQCLVDKVNDAILFPLIALMMAIAFLVFLYGGFEYVRNAASDSDRAKGQQHLLWGVIGMFVMISAYSILSIAAGTFGLWIEKVECSTSGASTFYGPQ